MKLKKKLLNPVPMILIFSIFSGCGTILPPTIIHKDIPSEKKVTEDKKKVEDVREKEVAVIEEPEQEKINPTAPSGYSVKSPPRLSTPVIMPIKHSKSEDTDPLTDQELIDSALDYCQASNDFWEQGDLDNAIDALDKAYSLILKVKRTDDPELLQQKEDLRFTISKRIIEVYSSRITVANGSHKAIPLDMNSHVKEALNLFKGREKNFFLNSYARSGKYRPAIVRALKAAGLPEELSWLPLIESGFNVRAMSRARALGMWQFIASTGYKYGLKRDTWIDERMDPEKSTSAAIAYLTELHQIFGDWTTVLAAYNCGERRVLSQIRTQKINYLDNFWDLYEKLPSETAFYVPKFLAVLHILHDPKAYGFDLPPLDSEMESEEVTVNKQVHLKTIAEGIGVSYDLLKDLNPELRQYLTPKTPYALDVPVEKGEVLLAKLNDIPAWRPPVPEYVLHKVRPGESLSVIAGRYKTSISAIMRLNGLKSKDYLKVGWRLKIPTREGSSTAVTVASSSSSVPEGKLNEYVVQKGDSLWTIANRFNITVNAIKSLNRLRSSDLQIGQVLMLSTGLTASEPGKTRKYKVRKGDSPYLIAKRHKMNLSDFLKLNSLTPRSTIFPGQTVRIVAE